MIDKWMKFLGKDKLKWCFFVLFLPVLIVVFGAIYAKTDFWLGLTLMVVGFSPILTVIFSKSNYDKLDDQQ